MAGAGDLARKFIRAAVVLTLSRLSIELFLHYGWCDYYALVDHLVCIKSAYNHLLTLMTPE